MKCRSKTRDVSYVSHIENSSYLLRHVRNVRYTMRNTREKAFSLPEVIAALAILALISSSVLVVIDRSITSTANSMLRMQAFEIARENMETLLSENLVKEIVQYGNSEKYPEIQWQTTVETFYEPITSKMWIRAVCSADYTDTEGQVQTVQLTHWLTDLTEKQIREIMEEKEKERLTEQEGTEEPIMPEEFPDINDFLKLIK